MIFSKYLKKKHLKKVKKFIFIINTNKMFLCVLYTIKTL